ncbi:unnamed protein product [Rhizophagus irregularis]|uniref:MATA-HMG n=2 Tax=Rhizophagus irregularis TaxID=588596 RepID=A0A1B1ETM4_9GLOM|nr:MATA-HMG [Rhizophagus irregularis]CAB4416466.1 unnamed protein product [Rhizophagus irregularis]CAB4417012.1 unnamed protein product [Rhizophagus irregularis]
MSSLVNSNSWQNKLKSCKGDYPTLKQQKTIEENFQRDDIFGHKYNVNDLFKQFYKVWPEESQRVKPKRQPNSFMILRAVLGLVANDKNIKSKIGDGTEQSRLASFIWGGASENEKNKFEQLCSEFKTLHRQLYPQYVYKPTPRNTKVGSVVEIKTAESYQSLGISTSISAPMGHIGRSFQTEINDTYQHQEEMEMEINTSELDQHTFFDGYFPYVQYNNQHYSSISVNCPDPNDGQTSFSGNVDLLTPHFTTVRHPFGSYQDLQFPRAGRQNNNKFYK